MTYEIWGIEPGAEAIKFCLETAESLKSIGDSDVEIRIKP
jgi:hypothetical protein